MFDSRKTTQLKLFVVGNKMIHKKPELKTNMKMKNCDERVNNNRKDKITRN